MDMYVQEQLGKIYMERARREARQAHRPAQRSGRAPLIEYVHIFTRTLFPAMAIAGRKQI